MYIIIDNENVHSLNAKEKSSFIEQSSSDDQISLILESDDVETTPDTLLERDRVRNKTQTLYMGTS